jgi:hypothetical protein
MIIALCGYALPETVNISSYLIPAGILLSLRMMQEI